MYYPEKIILHNFLNHRDTEYKFSAGKPIVITGNNTHGKGQASNGSGKSSLIDGISFAITGDTSRSVVNKELIFYDEKEAFVELYLKSDKDTLIIKRTIYQSKSQVCDITLNSKSIELSEINEYNRWILDEIGISRDDLFSFYLLSKNNYKPFLQISDTLKKQIINRFSGAYLIDAVDPLIDKDITDVSDEILSVDKEIIRLESSIKVHQDIIDDLVENGDKKLEEKVLGLKEQKEDLEHSIESLKDNISETEKEISEKNRELFEINGEGFDEKISDIEYVINQRKRSIGESDNDIKDQEEKIQLEKSVFKEVLDEIESGIKDSSNILKELKGRKSDLEVKLMGSIECPKCQHEFIVKSDTSVDDIRDEIKKIEKEVELEQDLLDALRDEEKQTNVEQQEKINKLREGLRLLENRKESFRSELRELESDLNKVNEEKEGILRKKRLIKQSIENLKSDIDRFNLKIKQNKESISDIEEKVTSLKDNGENKIKIKEHRQKVSEIETLLNDQLDKLEIKSLSLEDKKEQKEIFKSFKTYLANKSLDNMSSIANKYLEDMVSSLSIEINGYKSISGGKKIKEEISSTIYRDGFEIGSYGRFSAGERGRIDMAIILTIQTLINGTTKGKGLDLLCCDEILDSVDTIGLENIVVSLKNVSKTVLLVSQNDLNIPVENVLVVKNVGGVASI